MSSLEAGSPWSSARFWDAACTPQPLGAVSALADLDLPPDALLAHLDDLVISLFEEDADRAAKAGQPGAAIPVLGTTCLYAAFAPVTRSPSA
ncbi:hypothetical protein AB0M68_28480 [Streptomyces sp. NPDC051453]|uniref:hypothetical protein n=1 Tax=Streptomyces sp. NPDC051453 TaxID=3154941 RepID=UPI003416B7F0